MNEPSWKLREDTEKVKEADSRKGPGFSKRAGNSELKSHPYPILYREAKAESAILTGVHTFIHTDKFINQHQIHPKHLSQSDYKVMNIGQVGQKIRDGS